MAKLAAYWLFPGLVIASTLGNQPFVVAMILGQVVALMCDVAAVVILLRAFRRPGWVLVVVTCVLVAKGLRLVSGSGSAEIAYIVLLNALFCASGAIVGFQRPRLLYKQVMTICLVSLFFMVFQVTGVGAWTQLLASYGEGNLTQPVPTLFVPESRLEYLLVQGRPAGIIYSNVVLSLIIMFAFALHFSRRTRTSVWGTALLCCVAVLAMAKIAFVGFLVTGMLVLVLGDRRQRRRIVAATGLFVVFFGLYAVLFPGLFATNVSIDTIQASVFYRANDIMAALNPNIDFRFLRMAYFADTPHLYDLEEGQFVSGYATLVAIGYRNLAAIAAAFVVGVGAFLIGLRRLERKFPERVLGVVLVVSVVALFPATHPIWPSPLYWFMAGLAGLPLIQFLKPRLMVRARSAAGMNAHRGVSIA